MNKKLYKALYDFAELRTNQGIKGIVSHYNKNKNITKLMKAINYITYNYKEDDLEKYKIEVISTFKDVVKDIEKIEKKELKSMTEIKKYENFLFENTSENITFKEIFNGMGKSTPSHLQIAAGYFKIPDNYIDVENADKHILKVSDISGDILNSARVTFNAMIFDEVDMNAIKKNIIDDTIAKMYILIPDKIEANGIVVNPLTIINKQELRNIINSIMVIDLLTAKISEISGYKFEKNYNGYFIFSKKF